MTNRPAGDKKVLKEFAFGLLKEGTSVRIIASGYSMYPSIKPEDIIIIHPIPDPLSLIPGEIIAWQRDTDFVVHRLIHIAGYNNRKYFLTRGDSSLSSDQTIGPDQLAGKVTSIERHGRTLPRLPNAFIPEWRYGLNRKKVWFIVRIKKVFSLLRGR
ncbi:MAG TPA: S24 family peptidase [Bacteroidales bacterium]|nr:S24 family peptidase [Bacteroidales bacterium]